MLTYTYQRNFNPRKTFNFLYTYEYTHTLVHTTRWFFIEHRYLEKTVVEMGGQR